MIDWTNCLMYLRETFTKFTENISISKFKISNSQFCSMVKVSKAIKKLEINYSKILTDSECDFGEIKNCKIKHLRLFQWGSYSMSNWANIKSRLENILIGIDRWENLRISLKTIDLSYSKSYNDEDILVEQIRKFPRLEHIKFTLK